MLIESKIKRAGGTDVELFGKTYEFRPDKIDRHVCEVKNRKAAERLLSIPEGYRPVMDDMTDDEIAELEELQDEVSGEGEGLTPGADSLDGDIVIGDEELDEYDEELDEEPEPTDPADDLAPNPETTDDTDETGDDEGTDPEAVRLEWEATFGKKAGRRKTETLLADLRANEQE